ncbi:hypothetical protein LA02_1217 [Francisella philomiragia]|uniref:hypothetical protein n=1 Tax=Francisella philomiragia TaxID=28110 RepID=UPI0005A57447|nr:hypothetical protein [Francisella philomiragia]AJI56979.1 hypothetical protein LA02_1217 [Francisella philomiragia]
MKNIILTFLSLSFLQISQAYFVKIAKDNHMSQPGYITTIYESNVQATAVNSDQTKLFTVFRPSDNYCLSVTKLSYSINNTGSITSCFDNKHTIGNKVNKIILDKLGKTFYLLSNYNILAYNISPITNRINGQIFRKRFIQKIIDAKLVDEGKYLYLLTTSDKSQKGKLIIYRVNTDGSLDELNIITLNYKPKKIIFDNIERVYIQSDKSIYFYSFLRNAKVIKDEKIITISSGEISDFSVITESSTESRVLLVGHSGAEGLEIGFISIYNFSSDIVRQIDNKVYKDFPKKIVTYKGEFDGQSKVLVAFNSKFSSGIVGSMKLLSDEYKVNGSFIDLLQNNNLVEVVYSNSVATYDLKEGLLLSNLFLNDGSNNTSFISNNFFGAGNEKNINIFQL